MGLLDHSIHTEDLGRVSLSHRKPRRKTRALVRRFGPSSRRGPDAVRRQQRPPGALRREAPRSALRFALIALQSSSQVVWSTLPPYPRLHTRRRTTSTPLRPCLFRSPFPADPAPPRCQGSGPSGASWRRRRWSGSCVASAPPSSSPPRTPPATSSPPTPVCRLARPSNHRRPGPFAPVLHRRGSGVSLRS